MSGKSNEHDDDGIHATFGREALKQVMERLLRDRPPIATSVFAFPMNAEDRPSMSMVLEDSPRGKALAVCHLQSPSEVMEMVKVIMISASAAFGSDAMTEHLSRPVTSDDLEAATVPDES